jgi:hypothetical protein
MTLYVDENVMAAVISDYRRGITALPARDYVSASGDALSSEYKSLVFPSRADAS